MSALTTWEGVPRIPRAARVTIERRERMRDASGHTVDVWSTRFADLPCRVPEGRFLPLTIRLPGYYPSITSLDRVRIDGALFDIRAAEHDASGALTRLFVEPSR